MKQYQSRLCQISNQGRKGSWLTSAFEYNDPLPDDFNSFLKNDDNKTDLNKLISQFAIRPTSWTWEGEVYVIYGKGVRSRSDGNVDIMLWIDGLHEETDNRIVIHIADMIRNDITKIKLRTVDTDVIVVMLAFMRQFLCTGDHRRLLNINDSYDELGDYICLGLLFFHCFTGFYSTCSFFRKTKRFLFYLWMKQQAQDNITNVFQHLSWLPSEDILGPGGLPRS